MEFIDRTLDTFSRIKNKLYNLNTKWIILILVFAAILDAALSMKYYLNDNMLASSVMSVIMLIKVYNIYRIINIEQIIHEDNSKDLTRRIHYAESVVSIQRSSIENLRMEKEALESRIRHLESYPPSANISELDTALTWSNRGTVNGVSRRYSDTALRGYSNDTPIRGYSSAAIAATSLASLGSDLHVSFDGLRGDLSLNIGGLPDINSWGITETIHSDSNRVLRELERLNPRNDDTQISNRSFRIKNKKAFYDKESQDW